MQVREGHECVQDRRWGSSRTHITCPICKVVHPIRSMCLENKTTGNVSSRLTFSFVCICVKRFYLGNRDVKFESNR